VTYFVRTLTTYGKYVCVERGTVLYVHTLPVRRIGIPVSVNANVPCSYTYVCIYSTYVMYVHICISHGIFLPSPIGFHDFMCGIMKKE
jgi:hypothetical protein